MRSPYRDRVLLIGAAVAIVAGSVVVSFVSYALGFDGIGVLVVVESVLVFGAALSYCETSWPKWYLRRSVRTRIVLILLIALATHCTILALTFRRLRAEWGGPVWMGIGLGEIICVTLILQAVVGRFIGRSRDSVDTPVDPR